MKRLLAFIIPILLLSACNAKDTKGKEINKEEATVIADKIENNQPDYKNIEIITKSNSSSYDANKDETTTTTSESTLKVNEKDEFEYYAKSKQGENENVQHYYYALDEEYQAVLYTIQDEKINVFAKSMDMFFDVTVSTYRIVTSVSTLFVSQYGNPKELIPEEEEEEENVVFHYYSSGENNLTIVVKNTYNPKEEEDRKEYAVSTEYTITYDNLVLSHIKLEGTSNLGNKSTGEIIFNYYSSKIDITLPSDYKERLEKKAKEVE